MKSQEILTKQSSESNAVVSVRHTWPVNAVHEHMRVLCHRFMSAAQPAAVVACSLNICRVNTNSTKAPFLRANTGKYSV